MSEDIGPRAVLHGAVFLLELRQIDAPLQHQPELVHVHRLAKKIVGAGPDGTRRILFVALAGDDDHLGQRVKRETLEIVRSANVVPRKPAPTETSQCNRPFSRP